MNALLLPHPSLWFVRWGVERFLQWPQGRGQPGTGGTWSDPLGNQASSCPLRKEGGVLICILRTVNRVAAVRIRPHAIRPCYDVIRAFCADWLNVQPINCPTEDLNGDQNDSDLLSVTFIDHWTIWNVVVTAMLNVKNSDITPRIIWSRNLTVVHT